MEADVHDFLEHHGVKGMKWGVRRTRRTRRLAEAGKAGSSKADRARVLLARRVGPIDLVRGRGIRGAAARKTVREVARDKRQRAGQSTIRDHVARYGSTRAADLVPVRSKNEHKRVALDNAKIALAVGGGLFIAKILMKTHSMQTA